MPYALQFKFLFQFVCQLHESASFQQLGRRRQQRTAEITLAADGQFLIVAARVGNSGFQHRQLQPLHHHPVDVEHLGIGPAFYLVPEEKDVLQRDFGSVADIVQHGGGEREAALHDHLVRRNRGDHVIHIDNGTEHALRVHRTRQID